MGSQRPLITPFSLPRGPIGLSLRFADRRSLQARWSAERQLDVSGVLERMANDARFGGSGLDLTRDQVGELLVFVAQFPTLEAPVLGRTLQADAEVAPVVALGERTGVVMRTRSG